MMFLHRWFGRYWTRSNSHELVSKWGTLLVSFSKSRDSRQLTVTGPAGAPITGMLASLETADAKPRLLILKPRNSKWCSRQQLPSVAAFSIELTVFGAGGESQTFRMERKRSD